jgi:hypothetical protein
MKINQEKLKAMYICCLGVFILAFVSCERTEPTMSPLPVIHSLQDIRELTPGTIPDGYTVTGTVISNKLLEDDHLIYIQDDSGNAIKVRFDTPHNYNLGDKIELYIAGSDLNYSNDEFEIRNAKLIYANRSGAGTIVPKITSASEVNKNIKAWSSSLLSLNAMKVTASLGEGIYVLTDSIGTATIQASIDESLSITLSDSVQLITGLLCMSGDQPLIRIRNAGDIVTYSPQIGSRTILEPFDAGGSTSMPNGDQVFTGFVSGDWMFNDAAVLGANEVNDLRNGAGTVRLRGNTINARKGYIYTLFDVKGLQKIRFKFGGTNLSEGGAEVNEYSIETFISTDGGQTWESLGKKIGERGVFTVMEYEVNGDPNENFRVKIQNTSFVRPDNSNRLRANVDDLELIY